MPSVGGMEGEECRTHHDTCERPRDICCTQFKDADMHKSMYSY